VGRPSTRGPILIKLRRYIRKEGKKAGRKGSVRFRFRFFKCSFYSKILVLLVLLYIKLKLLLSLGRCSS